MDDTKLANEISLILGFKVIIVLQDGGIAVFNEFLQSLFYSSSLPKNLTAEWVCKKIARKDADTARIKERREIGIAKMRDELRLKGVNNFSIYETSFGFSVCNLMGDGLEKAREIINKCKLDIKRIEYSKEHWVVRVIL